MRSLLALFFVVPYALAQFCGPDELPDKLAVNENGEVALGCRYNECPRVSNDPSLKNDNKPKCGKRYYELSCAGPLQWVGGIPRGSNLNNVVPLQCCTAQQLRDSPVGQNRKIVEFGQVFEGNVYYDKSGNVEGYDIIKNAQKIRVAEGRYAMSLTVSKFICGGKQRAAQFDNPEVAFQGFGDAQSAGVFQGPLQGFDGAGNGFAGQGGQFGPGGFDGVGDGFANQAGLFGAENAGAFQVPGDFGAGPAGFAPGPAAFGAPIAPPIPIAPAAGGGACFTGETMVETPSGAKRMDELKIGDHVLTVSHPDNIIGFSPVNSFLHRLPEKVAEFHRISTGENSVSLTPLHFIYTTPCDMMTPKMKYAEDVEVGECLVRVIGEKLRAIPVQSNEVFKSTGIYNPMTEAGTIVTDGFMSSVHNVYGDTTFMDTLVRTAQQAQKLISGESSSENVELPWALTYILDHVSKWL